MYVEVGVSNSKVMFLFLLNVVYTWLQPWDIKHTVATIHQKKTQERNDEVQILKAIVFFVCIGILENVRRV